MPPTRKNAPAIRVIVTRVPTGANIKIAPITINNMPVTIKPQSRFPLVSITCPFSCIYVPKHSWYPCDKYTFRDSFLTRKLYLSPKCYDTPLGVSVAGFHSGGYDKVFATSPPTTSSLPCVSCEEIVPSSLRLFKLFLLMRFLYAHARTQRLTLPAFYYETRLPPQLDPKPAVQL